MSCATCHEDNMGKMIRADHLSQGQVNGFPTYRLKQAGLIRCTTVSAAAFATPGPSSQGIL
jgi:hypothetical protein